MKLDPEIYSEALKMLEEVKENKDLGTMRQELFICYMFVSIKKEIEDREKIKRLLREF